MPSHSILQPVVDRPNIQIDGLDAAKRALYPAQGFVATYCTSVTERRLGQAGAHDIEPVGGRLGGNFSGLAGEAEGVVSDRQIEMLFHLVGVEHRTDRKRDRGGAMQRMTLALDSGFD